MKKGAKKAQAEAKKEEPERGVKFPDADALSPVNSPFTVEAWILPDSDSGVILAYGGPSNGYALLLKDKKPQFLVRSDKEMVVAASGEALPEGWHHLAAVLAKDKSMTLYVDGQKAAGATAKGLLGRPKLSSLTLGESSPVADGKMDGYTGMLDQVVLQMRALSADEVLDRVSQPEAKPAGAALVCTFDNGDARDDSGHGNNGIATGVETGKGKVGAALWFRKLAPGKDGKPPESGSYVQRGWDTFVPIITRSMALAGRTLAVGGPPDLLNEEYAFERMAAKDTSVQHDLDEQDASLNGQRGAKLWFMNVDTGERSGDADLDSPPVWDGMVVARGKLYVATVDGQLKCFGK